MITIRDAPDIRPFFDSVSGIRPDTRLPCRISGKAGYPAYPKIYVAFPSNKTRKKICTKIIFVLR
jgi:hypothetical protein